MKFVSKALLLAFFLSVCTGQITCPDGTQVTTATLAIIDADVTSTGCTYSIELTSACTLRTAEVKETSPGKVCFNEKAECRLHSDRLWSSTHVKCGGITRVTSIEIDPEDLEKEFTARNSEMTIRAFVSVNCPGVPSLKSRTCVPSRIDGGEGGGTGGTCTKNNDCKSTATGTIYCCRSRQCRYTHTSCQMASTCNVNSDCDYPGNNGRYCCNFGFCQYGNTCSNTVEIKKSIKTLADVVLALAVIYFVIVGVICFFLIRSLCCTSSVNVVQTGTTVAMTQHTMQGYPTSGHPGPGYPGPGYPQQNYQYMNQSSTYTEPRLDQTFPAQTVTPPKNA